MTDFSPWRIAAIAAVFFLAGLVKGLTGMGLPTTAMGLLAGFMPNAAAASLLVVPAFATNIWQSLAGPGLAALLRRFATMLLGIFAGSLLGTAALSASGGRWAAPALGLVLIAYAAYTLLVRQPRVSACWERTLSPLVGLVTGLVSGATGVFVVPAVPYLQALGMDREHLLQALGISFCVSTLSLAAGLAWHGVFEYGHLPLSLAVLAPAALGMHCGQRLLSLGSERTFRRLFLLCLLLLGMELASKPLF